MPGTTGWACAPRLAESLGIPGPQMPYLPQAD